MLFKIIKYQLYLLQLENYELGRYFKLLFKKGLWLPQQAQRKYLVWTNKARALFLMALGLHILSGVAVVWTASGRPYIYAIAAIAAIVLFWFYFLLFSVALILLWPLDWLLKTIVIARAKSKIKKLSNNLDPGSEAGMTRQGLKIIAIAGSYGKTTMKEVLRQILDARYKILATPESVNTPLGIARWILGSVNESTQIIIVEMGEHYKGDIEEICKITKPDIAVVTGINESHLERMKNMETVIATIFEAVGATKAGGMVVVNADDVRVMANYKKFVWPDHRVAEYKVESVKYKVFNTDTLVWQGEIDGVGKVEINLLGEYALGDVGAAVKIARSLGMTAEEIKRGVEKIKPVEHRLQPIKSAGNILVIDDAYNGNPDGVAEAIKVLSRFTNRRKVFITPGLVEMGKSSAEVHRRIGQQLAGVADVVVLIKNSVTGFIEEGINSSVIASPSASEGAAISLKDKIASSDALLAMTKIIWFNTAQEAHSSLSTILKPGDVVVFQNDWGDQYI